MNCTQLQLLTRNLKQTVTRIFKKYCFEWFSLFTDIGLYKFANECMINNTHYYYQVYYLFEKYNFIDRRKRCNDVIARRSKNKKFRSLIKNIVPKIIHRSLLDENSFICLKLLKMLSIIHINSAYF